MLPTLHLHTVTWQMQSLVWCKSFVIIRNSSSLDFASWNINKISIRIFILCFRSIWIDSYDDQLGFFNIGGSFNLPGYYQRCLLPFAGVLIHRTTRDCILFPLITKQSLTFRFWCNSQRFARTLTPSWYEDARQFNGCTSSLAPTICAPFELFDT